MSKATKSLLLKAKEYWTSLEKKRKNSLMFMGIFSLSEYRYLLYYLHIPITQLCIQVLMYMRLEKYTQSSPI